MSEITIRRLEGFNDARLPQAEWGRLLASGDTDTVFLTWHWQKAWWDVFGRGGALLLSVERDGESIAVAPLFSDEGMVFFVGSGGSDYLDFVGDIADEAVLDAILRAARDLTPGFLGFRLYHVPDASRTGCRLGDAARRLGLVCYDEGSLPAPALDLAGDPEVALAATRKKSLVRHERHFERNGDLAVHHSSDSADIEPHLDAFFEQHIARWESTPYPSLFTDPSQRRFYEKLTQAAADAGWLRFTRVEWDGRQIAFHFGFSYQGGYMWYKPTFDIELARRSPGEVLIRQLLLAAIDEGAHTFDFGLGDEAFKGRFATTVNHVRTWGLYAPEVCEGSTEGDTIA